MNEQEEQARNYSQKKYEPNERPLLKFRLVKLELHNQRWKNLKATSTEHLKKLLTKHAPKNAYMSNACWLNPLATEKPKNKTADSLFMGAEVWIESDIEEDLQKAKTQIIKAHKTIQTHYPMLKHERFVFSGKKGFYSYYSYKNPHKNPENRLNMHKKVLRQVLSLLKKKGLELDYTSCQDIYRVTRIENSYRSSGQTAKTFKNLNELLMFKPPESPKGDDPFHSKSTETRATPKPGVRGLSTHKSINNNVKKSYYPALVLGKKNIKLVKKASKTYNTPFFLFETKKNILAISPKIVSQKRLTKIMKFCKALNQKSFEKYKTTWTKTTSTKNAKTWKDTEQKPKFTTQTGTLKNTDYYSETILKWLKKHAPINTNKLKTVNHTTKTRTIIHTQRTQK